MTKDDINESRRICEAATPGPWWVRGGGPVAIVGLERRHRHDGPDDIEIHIADSGLQDGEFCAHARTALPAALDEIERLHEDRDSWRRVAEELQREVGRLRDRK